MVSLLTMVAAPAVLLLWKNRLPSLTMLALAAVLVCENES